MMRCCNIPSELVLEGFKRVRAIALYDADMLIVPWHPDCLGAKSTLGCLPEHHALHHDADFTHYLSDMGDYVIVGVFVKEIAQTLSLLIFEYWPEPKEINRQHLLYHGKYTVDWGAQSFDLEPDHPEVKK